METKMQSNFDTPKAEHEIHFAQPTSPLAVRLKLPDGGWVLSQAEDRHASFESYHAAINSEPLVRR